MPFMEDLLAAHLKIQDGCYLSGSVDGPDGSKYFYSDLVPDSPWNFGVPLPGAVHPGVVAWLSDIAVRQGRMPAAFVRDDVALASLRTACAVREVVPERWMAALLAEPIEQVAPEVLTHHVVNTEASPGVDFERVFGSLFADASLNSHFSQYYIPTLARARPSNSGAVPFHVVGYGSKGPICCASVYALGSFAGLYNVGTVSSAQRQGLGAWVSAIALNVAQKAGCTVAFLQCEVESHVERLYLGLGFEIVATPSIATWEA
jgi:GNAT superfamily N-acetyltransferase